MAPTPVIRRVSSPTRLGTLSPLGSTTLFAAGMPRSTVHAVRCIRGLYRCGRVMSYAIDLVCRVLLQTVIKVSGIYAARSCCYGQRPLCGRLAVLNFFARAFAHSRITSAAACAGPQSTVCLPDLRGMPTICESPWRGVWIRVSVGT